VGLRLVEGDLLENDDRYGVILAGDVCYSRDMSGRMLAFLRRAAARGSLVLIGDPGRAYLPGEGLAAAASYDIPVVEALESVPVRHTTVWRVK
jgi:predicted nicotinamide N-methyase